MGEDHHKEIIEKMGEHGKELESQQNVPPPIASSSGSKSMLSPNQNVVYNYHN